VPIKTLIEAFFSSILCRRAEFILSAAWDHPSFGSMLSSFPEAAMFGLPQFPAS
jgi:hypothetical protein